MDEANKKAVLELELALAALNDALYTCDRARRIDAISRAKVRVELAYYRLTGAFPADALRPVEAVS